MSVAYCANVSVDTFVYMCIGKCPYGRFTLYGTTYLWQIYTILLCHRANGCFAFEISTLGHKTIFTSTGSHNFPHNKLLPPQNSFSSLPSILFQSQFRSHFAVYFLNGVNAQSSLRFMVNELSLSFLCLYFNIQCIAKTCLADAVSFEFSCNTELKILLYHFKDFKAFRSVFVALKSC